jgi:hypothetical protein
MELCGSGEAVEGRPLWGVGKPDGHVAAHALDRLLSPGHRLSYLNCER